MILSIDLDEHDLECDEDALVALTVGVASDARTKASPCSWPPT